MPIEAILLTALTAANDASGLMALTTLPAYAPIDDDAKLIPNTLIKFSLVTAPEAVAAIVDAVVLTIIPATCDGVKPTADAMSVITCEPTKPVAVDISEPAPPTPPPMAPIMAPFSILPPMAAADNAPIPAPITAPPKVAAPTAPAPSTASPIAKAAPPVKAPAAATAISARPGATSF